MKQRICSDRHFERLIKSFSKKFLNEIQTSIHFKNFKDYFWDMFYDPEDSRSDINRITNKLFLNFKLKPYKTCSKVSFKKNYFTNNDDYNFRDSEVWISYTIEDQNCIRIRNNDLKDKFIVFKVHIKIENQQKKRIFRWKVKINWL